ncbi:hypothetical protein LZ31DRAFT_50644 [Colletotrichum somersetense]|nr:hypothetical protein LZ31DRAFT_50644 [Colletotrichum somersetense]
MSLVHSRYVPSGQVKFSLVTLYSVLWVPIYAARTAGAARRELQSSCGSPPSLPHGRQWPADTPPPLCMPSPYPCSCLIRGTQVAVEAATDASEFTGW